MFLFFFSPVEIKNWNYLKTGMRGNCISPAPWNPACMWHMLFQFSSVAQSYLTLCDPMDCSTPGFTVHHQLPEFTQTHVHRVGDAIQPSHPAVPFSSCPQSLPASGSFPMSQLLAWGGQSIGVSALASVLPMNTQDWSPILLSHKNAFESIH